MGCAVLLSFIVITDLRILLFSDFPYLYGIQDTFHSRFEETVLYLPYLSNFSLFDFFKIDYTGANVEQGLAPYPYFSILVVGLIGLITGDHINIAILFAHSLIIIQYVLVYSLLHQYRASDVTATALALLICWDITYFPFIAVVVASTWWVSKATISLIPKQPRWGWSKRFIVAGSMAGLVLISYAIRPLRHQVGLVVEELKIVLEKTAETILYYISALHQPWYADVYATRFLSPVLPLLVFFGTVWYLLWMYTALRAKKIVPNWCWIAAALIVVVNFYTYYANWLILGPVVALWLWSVRHYLKTQLRTIVWASVTGLITALPFIYTLVASRFDPTYSEFVWRAGLFGMQEYSSNNMPVLHPMYLYAANFITLGSIWSWYSRKTWPSFPQLAPLVGLWTSYGFYKLNSWVPDTIPQAYLLQRYFVPLLVLALGAWWLTTRPVKPIAPTRAPSWLHYAYSALSGGIAVVWFGIVILTGIGRYNVHEDFSGPAMQQLVEDIAYLNNNLPDRDAVVVSNESQLNLLLPGVLGLRTLRPNPIITLGTNTSLLEQYALETKLLGGTKKDYITLIGDIDLMGVVHERSSQSTTAVSLYTQLDGTAYPISSDWIQSNTKTINTIYQTTDIATGLQTHQPIYLYLVNTELAESVTPYFALLTTDGVHSIYKSK